MRTYTGSPELPLTELIRSTIDVHGLHFAVQFYSRRIPAFQLRVLLRSAMGV